MQKETGGLLQKQQPSAVSLRDEYIIEGRVAVLFAARPFCFTKILVKIPNSMEFTGEILVDIGYIMWYIDSIK